MIGRVGLTLGALILAFSFVARAEPDAVNPESNGTEIDTFWASAIPRSLEQPILDVMMPDPDSLNLDAGTMKTVRTLIKKSLSGSCSLYELNGGDERSVDLCFARYTTTTVEIRRNDSDVNYDGSQRVRCLDMSTIGGNLLTPSITLFPDGLKAHLDDLGYVAYIDGQEKTSRIGWTIYPPLNASPTFADADAYFLTEDDAASLNKSISGYSEEHCCGTFWQDTDECRSKRYRQPY